jgi:hypothetical protein
MLQSEHRFYNHTTVPRLYIRSFTEFYTAHFTECWDKPHSLMDPLYRCLNCKASQHRNGATAKTCRLWLDKRLLSVYFFLPAVDPFPALLPPAAPLLFLLFLAKAFGSGFRLTAAPGAAGLAAKKLSMRICGLEFAL